MCEKHVGCGLPHSGLHLSVCEVLIEGEADMKTVSGDPSILGHSLCRGLEGMRRGG